MRGLNPLDCPILNRLSREHPLQIIDVGAAEGIDPLWMDYCLNDNGYAYGFEPFPENFEKLTDSKSIKYFQIALSDKVGEAEFFGLTTVGSLSRRVDREQRFGESYENIRVKTETLANLRNKGDIPSLDAIKIDVEGTESAVLRGAGDYLDEALYVKAEFSFERSAGNSFCDIQKILCQSGLRLFDFAANYTLYRSLSGGDVLFMKDISWLTSSKKNKKWIKISVLKLITIAIMNNYYEYAYYCAAHAKNNNILNKEESEEILRHCKKSIYIPLLIGDFPGKHAVNRVIFNISHIFSGIGINKSTAKENRLVKSPRLWTDNIIIHKIFKNKYDKYWNHLLK